MQTKRLFFRELQMSDAARLFEIYSDKEAMKYREAPHHETIDDSFKMLTRDAEVRFTKYEFRFAIIEQETNLLIGTIMYQPIYHKAIIGYSLAKESWGNGYATEIVNWIINYLKQQKFNLIEAWVRKENLASSKVLKKNEFKKISQTIFPNSFFYQLNLN